MAKDENLLSTKSQDNYTTEKINVISNCLFGNYVGDEYVISDEIKKELLDDRKVKKSVYKNSVFCSAYIIGYGDVVFEATFQKNTVKNVAMAELFVLENEYKVNGYIQNTIRTKIAEFISDIDNFIEKAYNHFNIVITDDDKGKDYNLKEDISLNAYINAKKNFNLSMAKLTSKDYNKLYKKYVTARLEKLKKTNNNFSAEVLNKFNGEFSKIEKYFLRDNNYKAVSELLDKCIEDCAGINPKFKQDEQEIFANLTPIINDFSKEADQVYSKAQTKALDSLNKSDRTRMEDIERELHQQQDKVKELEKQDKKPEKVEPVKSGSISTSSSSSSTKEPIKEPTKPSSPQYQPAPQPQPTPQPIIRDYDKEGQRDIIRGGSVLNSRDYVNNDNHKQYVNNDSQKQQEITQKRKETNTKSEQIQEKNENTKTDIEKEQALSLDRFHLEMGQKDKEHKKEEFTHGSYM